MQVCVTTTGCELFELLGPSCQTSTPVAPHIPTNTITSSVQSYSCQQVGAHPPQHHVADAVTSRVKNPSDRNTCECSTHSPNSPTATLKTKASGCTKPLQRRDTSLVVQPGCIKVERGEALAAIACTSTASANGTGAKPMLQSDTPHANSQHHRCNQSSALALLGG